MNIFIAIVSAGKFADRRAACRETWLANCGVPYKFFIGKGTQPEADDVVALDCPDTYDGGLCKKIYAALRWVYDRGFDCFKVDDDSYVVVDRLLKSGIEAYDTFGCNGGTVDIHPDGHSAPFGYIHGGSGYWLSRKAIKLILDDTRLLKAKHPYEDTVIGTILGGAGIKLQHDDRFQIEHHLCPLPSNDLISCHHCSAADLRQIHKWFIGEAAFPIKSKFETGQKFSLKDPALLYTYPRGCSPRLDCVAKNKKDAGVIGEKSLFTLDYAGEDTAWRFVAFKDGTKGFVDESALEAAS